MALEPITRAEQIIAGKDLEPITRMEMFLKEYGGGSSGGEEPFFTATVDFDMSAENLISGFNYGGTETREYYPLVKLSDEEVAKFIDAKENDYTHETNVMVLGTLLAYHGFNNLPGEPLTFEYQTASVGTVNIDAFAPSTYQPGVYIDVTKLLMYLTGENKGKAVVCRESIPLQVKTK